MLWLRFYTASEATAPGCVTGRELPRGDVDFSVATPGPDPVKRIASGRGVRGGLDGRPAAAQEKVLPHQRQVVRVVALEPDADGLGREAAVRKGDQESAAGTRG